MNEIFFALKIVLKVQQKRRGSKTNATDLKNRVKQTVYFQIGNKINKTDSLIGINTAYFALKGVRWKRGVNVMFTGKGDVHRS